MLNLVSFMGCDPYFYLPSVVDPHILVIIFIYIIIIVSMSCPASESMSVNLQSYPYFKIWNLVRVYW